MFSGRAPDGYVSLTGYLGGARYPDIAELSENELIALAEEEFKDLLGVRGRPEIVRVRRWPRGIPQYNLGHQARIKKIQDIALETPGLFVTGNYLSGPSVGACVAISREVVDRTSSYLGLSRSTEKRTLRGIVM